MFRGKAILIYLATNRTQNPGIPQTPGFCFIVPTEQRALLNNKITNLAFLQYLVSYIRQTHPEITP